MRWNAGILAGLLIGLVWVLAGTTLVVIGRRRERRSDRDGVGGAAIVGIFLLVVAGLTWFATLLLAVVPGQP